MPIRFDEYDGVCVLSAEGEFMEEDVEQVKAEVEEMFGRDVVDFVFDLGKCPFVDSAALESLTWMQDRCDQLFGRLSLADLTENVEKILTLTRLRPRFEVAGDVDTAIKRLR